jgi:hypothetical protein
MGRGFPTPISSLVTKAVRTHIPSPLKKETFAAKEKKD